MLEHGDAEAYPVYMVAPPMRSGICYSEVRTPHFSPPLPPCEPKSAGPSTCLPQLRTSGTDITGWMSASNSDKAVKDSQISDANQWPGFILSSFNTVRANQWPGFILSSFNTVRPLKERPMHPLTSDDRTHFPKSTYAVVPVLVVDSYLLPTSKSCDIKIQNP